MESSESNVTTRDVEEQKPSSKRAVRGSSSSISKSKSTSAKKDPEAEGRSVVSSNTGSAADLNGNSGTGGPNGTDDTTSHDDLEPKELRAIIRKRTDGAFLVYLDNNLQVCWNRTTDVFENGSSNANSKDVERILAKAQTIGAMPVPFLTEQQIETRSRIVGESVALALSGDVLAANRTLKDARDFIKEKAVEKARIWTVEGSLGSFMLLAVLFIGIAVYGPDKIAGVNLKELSIAAVFGLIGSQFSLLQRVNDLGVAPLSGATPHVVEAFSRIFVGALAGLIMYVVLRAQIFFGFIDHDPTNGVSEHWVTWSLVVVAGASERLIPNFMTTIETQAAGDLVTTDDKPKGESPTS